MSTTSAPRQFGCSCNSSPCSCNTAAPQATRTVRVESGDTQADVARRYLIEALSRWEIDGKSPLLSYNVRDAIVMLDAALGGQIARMAQPAHMEMRHD